MESTDKRSRLLYIDNIRWTMIVLVILIHANVSYGPVGDFFGYKDRANSGDASDMVFTLISVLIQPFFMGLLFLIAGYFVTGSRERKGSGTFVKDRFVRLVVPSLIFIFFLAPMIGYALYGRDETSLVEYIASYLPDVPNWDSGPMWFAIALFIFSAAFALTSGSKIWKLSAPKLSRKLVLGLVLFVSGVTFLVRIPFPVGTDVWNMQLCFFTQYIVLFVVGVAAYRNDWLASLTKKDGRFWLIVAIASIFLMMFPLMILGGGLEGDFDAYSGGMRWQAAGLALWEQVFGIGMTVWLLVWFRERRNSQSRLTRKISDNSFSVYLFHPPVVIGIALLLEGSGLPIMAKFLMLFASALAVTFALSEFVLRRIPGLKRIL